MMSEPLPRPENCRSLDQVFSAVEAVDRLILELLSQRFALVRTAAGIEHGLAHLDDDERRGQSIAAARRIAFELGVPVGLVGEFWDRLCDASLASGRQAERQRHP